MPAFGRNKLPMRLGGGRSALEVEHETILDQLKDAFDTDEGTELWSEVYADAVAVAIIWALNGRLRNQALPLRMLENLTVWEEACGLRPTPDQCDYERRQRLAAKLRGLANNALADIEAACSRVLGDNYVGLVIVDPDDVVSYWPGVNPGPPGYEWSSNYARLGVRMTEDALGDPEFEAKRSALSVQLDTMLPAWMGYCIGVGSAFTVGSGIVGKTFI